MSLLADYKFEFIFEGTPKDTFAVVEFTGEEGLSHCYSFKIKLVTGNDDLVLSQLLQNPARLIIHHDNGQMVFHGIISHMDQLQRFDQYTFYQAVLTPRLHWLNLTRHNQVFLDQSLPDILASVLEDGGLTGLDYEMRLPEELSSHYPTKDFFCQYGESHFHFFSYWTEALGLYYFFEQGPDREKVIITDTKMAHVDSLGGAALRYETPSGLVPDSLERTINTFSCRHRLLPRKVLMKDYDYERPSLDLTVEAEVAPHGLGEVYLYGDSAQFRTPEEGRDIARIRAEELKCHEQEFSGRSLNPLIRPGYQFQVEGHYQQEFNRNYLATRVVHQGNQVGYLISGLQKVLVKRETEPFYKNEFHSIPADLQFRPPLKTTPSRIQGTIGAVIDASGSGQYAEVDESGRYKVILPFDLSGKQGLKASAWLRMTQPYTGSDHGMHFPLHRGTEVLLSFIGGDPNRPVIIGSVPNGANPSMIGSGNASMAGFRTAGGNQFHMEDQDGHQRLIMKAGDQGKSYFRLGAGSESELWLGSESINSTADVAATEFCGLNKTIGSMVSASTLTGFVKFQLLKKMISTAIGKLPNFGYKLYQDVSTRQKSDKKEALKAKKKEAESKAKAFEEEEKKALADAQAADQKMNAAMLKAAEAQTEAEKNKALQEADQAKSEANAARQKAATATAGKEAAQKEADAYQDSSDDIDGGTKLEKGISGLASKVVLPFANLLLQLTLLKFATWVVKSRMKSGINPKDLKDKYTGNYAFSVVHHDGATLVSQQGNSKYLTKTLGAIGKGLGFPEAGEPESMFMGTNKGSLLFAAKQDVDVYADEKMLMDSNQSQIRSRESHLQEAPNTMSFSKNGYTVYTGSRPQLQPASDKKNLNLIAGNNHDIHIKQASSNTTGKITLESNAEIKIQTVNNTITVDKSKITIQSGDPNDWGMAINMENSTLKLKTALMSNVQELEIGATGVTVKNKNNDWGKLDLGMLGAEMKAYGNTLKLGLDGAKVNGKTIKLG